MTLKIWKFINQMDFMRKRIQRGVVVVFETSSVDPEVDAEIFVCQDKPIIGTTPAAPVADPAAAEFIIYPSRVLQTIASRQDIDELPNTPATAGDLYRTVTVSALFDWEQQADHFIDLVKRDVKRNAYLQRLPHMVNETVDLEDPLEDTAPLVYTFR